MLPMNDYSEQENCIFVLLMAQLATQLDTAEDKISESPPVILSAISPRSPKHSQQHFSCFNIKNKNKMSNRNWIIQPR